MHDQAETRPMGRSELQNVLSWAADEGWNPGIADAPAFHAADPDGFFLTLIDKEPAAAVSVVNHNADNAFLGLYICRPDLRGRGLGMATWRIGMEHAGSRSIGLDGVPEQEQNYKASGFRKTGSSLRHEGRVEGSASPNVRTVSADDIQSLIALDAQANGLPRARFMHAWLLNEPSARGTRVLRRDRQVEGFATWRACQNGTKIGPIVAPDVSAALELIADIALLRPDGPLIVDLPESNVNLRRELELANFSIPFVTARMYRGNVPQAAPILQAIATMELG